jgi:vanillin dehydrogenase
LYYSPTILTGVTSEMEIYAEESFGPVVCVYTFKNVESAIAAVNESEFGLSGAVVTENEENGYAIAMQMESGMCHVNDGTIYGEALAPFGGVKNSGMGRYGGLASVESFTSTRWITIDKGARHYPPPFVEK